jgi:hypothetical protein
MSSIKVILVGLLLVQSALFAQSDQLDPASRDALANSFLDDAAKQLEHISAAGANKNPQIVYRLAETIYNQAAIVPRQIKRSKREEHIVALTKNQKALLVRAYNAIAPLADKCTPSVICAKSILLKGMILQDAAEAAKAEVEYRRICKTNWDRESTELSQLHLAELLVDKRQFPEATDWLKGLQNSPHRKLAALAIERLSWTYYQMADYKNALDANAKLLQFALEESKEKASRRRDNVALNAAIFYAGGVESNTPGFSGQGAYTYFTNLVPEPHLTSAIQVFPTLLISPQGLPAVEAFVDELVKYRSNSPDTKQLLLSVLEQEAKRGRFSDLKTRFEAWETLDRKHSSVSDLSQAAQIDQTFSVIERIAQQTSLNAVEPVHTLALESLSCLYRNRIRYVQHQHARLVNTYFNLAAVELGLQRLDKSETYYRTVIKLAKDGSELALAKTASAKSIELRKVLVLRAEAASPRSPSTIKMLREWDGWVKYHLAHFNAGLIEESVFELDSTWHTSHPEQESVVRLENYLTVFHEPKHSMTATKEILAYFADRADWKGLLTETTVLKQIKSLDRESLNLVASTGEQTRYRIVRDDVTSHNYAEAIEFTEPIYAENSAKPEAMSKVSFDTLILCADGTLADANGKQEKALSYLQLASRRFPSNELTAKQQSLQAQIAESHFDFDNAATFYTQYLGTIPKLKSGVVDIATTKRAVQTRIMFLELTSGDPARLSATAHNQAICTENFAVLCDQMLALSLLKRNAGTVSHSELKLAMKHRKPGLDANDWMWASVKLANPEGWATTIPQQLALFDQITVPASESRQVFDIEFYTEMARLVPSAYDSIRSELSKKSGWDATPVKIATQIALLRKIDKSAPPLSKMLGETAGEQINNSIEGMYTDADNDLTSKLQNPRTKIPTAQREVLEEIVSAIEKKIDDLQPGAREISDEIADQDSDTIAPMLQDELPPNVMPIEAIEQLKGLEAAAAWPVKWKDDVETAREFRSTLISSAKQKHWARVAYLVKLNQSHHWIGDIVYESQAQVAKSEGR